LLLTDFLLRSSRPGPILVLGTYRDTELGRQTPLTSALADLRRGGALDRVDLHGLALDDVAALTASVLGNADVAPRVHARTGGNADRVRRGPPPRGDRDAPVRGGVERERAARGRDARARRSPRARPARLRGRGGALRARA